MSLSTNNDSTTQNERKKRTNLSKETKKIMENMIKDNVKPKEISKILGISLSTVHKNSSKLHKCVEDNTEFNLNVKPGKKKRIDQTPIESKVMEIIQDDCCLTQKGIIDKLEENQLKCSQSCISKILKKNDITRKRLKLRTVMSVSINVVNQRKVYARELRRIPDSRLLYLDETGFNLHSSINYGYSPKNMEAIKVLPSSKGKNISVVAIISNTQIAHHKAIDGSYNAALLEEFLQECIDKNIFNIDSMLVLDNVRFHHCTSIIDFLEANHIGYKFLPSYRPQLNPIENVFSMIKARYKAIRPRPTTLIQLKRSIEAITRGINRDETIELSAFYENMRRYINMAFQIEAF